MTEVLLVPCGVVLRNRQTHPTDGIFVLKNGEFQGKHTQTIALEGCVSVFCFLDCAVEKFVRPFPTAIVVEKLPCGRTVSVQNLLPLRQYTLRVSE